MGGKKTSEETEILPVDITGDAIVRIAQAGDNWKTKFSSLVTWILTQFPGAISPYHSDNTYAPDEYVSFSSNGADYAIYLAVGIVAATQSPETNPELWELIAQTNNYINISYSNLGAAMLGSALSYPGIYNITNGVGGTKVIVVFAESISTIKPFAINLTDSVIGIYDYGTDTFTGTTPLPPATATTVDATPTTISTVSIPNDSIVAIECKVVAKWTGGISGTQGDSLFVLATFVFKNVSGTVTIETISGQPDLNYITASQLIGALPAWTLSYIIAGTDVSIQVNGVADNNISWTNYLIITEL